MTLKYVLEITDAMSEFKNPKAYVVVTKKIAIIDYEQALWSNNMSKWRLKLSDIKFAKCYAPTLTSSLTLILTQTEMERMKL